MKQGSILITLKAAKAADYCDFDPESLEKLEDLRADGIRALAMDLTKNSNSPALDLASAKALIGTNEKMEGYCRLNHLAAEARNTLAGLAFLFTEPGATQLFPSEMYARKSSLSQPEAYFMPKGFLVTDRILFSKGIDPQYQAQELEKRTLLCPNQELSGHAALSFLETAFWILRERSRNSGYSGMEFTLSEAL